MTTRSLTWTDDLTLGIDDIDREHRGLMEVVNEILVACDSGLDSAMLGALFAQLRKSSLAHFAREERMLADTLQHRQEHAELIEQLDRIGAQAVREAEGGEVADATVIFLRHWLTSHIVGPDRGYSGYVKGREKRIRGGAE
ncbi:MAG: hemerythrin domain-containing protein [Alphaproteobacteria bacterium]|nr:hemerythrin domain-containing protein [Alphaproteobacteria bacterium]